MSLLRLSIGISIHQKTIENDKAILGVCLGAQLIGEALGAKFDHSPNREIGVFDISLTEDAQTDPFFSQLPKTFKVGHWHGDMPGLTKDSKILAYSEGCPRQVVRYTPKVYGFQCHFEFNETAVKDMIKNCSQELEMYKGLPYVETAKQMQSHNYKGMNQKLYTFLDYLKSKVTK